MGIIRYINILIYITLPVLMTGQIVYQEENTDPVYTQFSSVNLDGLDQYISIRNADIDFDSSSAFSLEFWVKPLEASALENVLKKGDAGGGYLVEFENTNIETPHVSFQIGLQSNYHRIEADYTGTESITTKSNLLNRGFFYHIVCTYSGVNDTSGMKIYINSVLAVVTPSSSGSNPIIYNTDSLYIANNNGDAGKIGFSQFRVYNFALSGEQVGVLYGSGLPKQAIGAYSPVVDISCFDISEFKGVSSSDIVNERKFPGNRKMFGLVRAEGRTRTHPGYGVFGTEEGSTLQYISPVNQLFYAPNIHYDSTSNKTYITGLMRGHAGFDNAAVIGELNHTSNVFRWVQKLRPASQRLNDSHMTPSSIRYEDTLIVVREKDHIASAKLAKGVPGSISESAEFGSSTAYNNLFYIGDTLYSFFRASGTGGITQGQAVCTSTNNGLTWSANSVFLDANTVDWAAYPHYTQSPVSDTTFLFVCGRTTQALYAGFYQISVYKTADMVNFYTMPDSLIGVRGTVDKIDKADIFNHTLIDKTTDSSQYQMYLYCSRADTAGRLAVVYRDEESAVDSIRVAIWEGGQWVKKNTEIGTNQQAQAPTGALVYKGGANWDLFVIETRAGYDVVVKYATTDDFSTLDSGTIVSEANAHHTQIASTKYHQIGQPMVITSNRLVSSDDETTALWIYNYTP